MKMELINAEYFSYPYPHLIGKIDIESNEDQVASLISEIHESVKIMTLNDNFQKTEVRNCPGLLGMLMAYMQSTQIMELCERAFSTEKLMPDPGFDGGGLTITSAGGYLRYHHDFPYSNSAKAYRVVNALLYLNKSNLIGGDLHLIDPSSRTVEKIISPSFGLFVAFPTSKNTPHGFSRIKSGDRVSINSYFYSELPLDDRVQPCKTEWLY